MIMADVAISSSKSEGLPFNIMESMACGLPVLASNVKGHVDLIEEGKGGYLFKIHKEDFLEKFKLLIWDKNKREYFGKYNSKRIEKYDLTTALYKIIDIYNTYID